MYQSFLWMLNRDYKILSV